MPNVLIIGYGSQGRPQALNLRDSGWNVSVYLPKNSKKIKVLKKDGLKIVKDLSKEIRSADHIVMLLPDSKQPEFYRKNLHGKLKKGAALIFAHGYSIHYKKIIPQKDVNVVLVAPSAQGEMVRASYKIGFPAFIAAKNKAGWEKAKKFAKAIGGKKLIKTTFKDETEVDLFAEQTVVCGGLHAIIKTAFDTLIKNGYSKDVAYFSCLKETVMLAKLISDKGLLGMYENISDTARYGGYTRGERISRRLKPLYRKIMNEVQSGKFLRERERSHKNIPPKSFKKHLINRMQKLVDR